MPSWPRPCSALPRLALLRRPDRIRDGRRSTRLALSSRGAPIPVHAHGECAAARVSFMNGLRRLGAPQPGGCSTDGFGGPAGSRSDRGVQRGKHGLTPVNKLFLMNHLHVTCSDHRSSGRPGRRCARTRWRARVRDAAPGVCSCGGASGAPFVIVLTTQYRGSIREEPHREAVRRRHGGLLGGGSAALDGGHNLNLVAVAGW